jgi:hypothetical protein
MGCIKRHTGFYAFYQEASCFEGLASALAFFRQKQKQVNSSELSKDVKT